MDQLGPAFKAESGPSRGAKNGSEGMRGKQLGRGNSSAAAQKAKGAHEGLTPLHMRKGRATPITRPRTFAKDLVICERPAYLAPSAWQALARENARPGGPKTAVKSSSKANKAVQKALGACRVV